MQVPDFSTVTDADKFVESVLPLLNVEEKVLLLSGKDAWRTNAVPRVGISSMKTSDGPVGVRGSLYTDGIAGKCSEGRKPPRSGHLGIEC